MDEPSPVREGEVLAGKYRVEGVLGVGGMGVVVCARHLALDRRVAVKFLLPASLRHQDTVERFAREARALSKLTSEHVTRVVDVGTLENGSPYLVMEYLDGRNLAEMVREGGPLGIAPAVDFVLQACEALAEAHASGIVHRDLKPGNLFVTRATDGSACLKVLDFGISKFVERKEATAAVSLTGTTELLGSPLYMSPEQLLASRDVDERTDVWALGAVLYELLVGAPPFDADTIPTLCTRILHAPAPLLRERRADAPEGLERVVLRCLEKERTARFATVADLAAALEPFGGEEARRSRDRIARILRVPGGAVAMAGTVAADVSPRATTDPSWSRTGRERDAPAPMPPKKPVAAVAAGLAVVAVGAAVVVAAVVRSGAPLVSGPRTETAAAGTATPTAIATTTATATATTSDPSAPPIATASPAAATAAPQAAADAGARANAPARPAAKPTTKPRGDIDLFDTQK